MTFNEAKQIVQELVYQYGLIEDNKNSDCIYYKFPFPTDITEYGWLVRLYKKGTMFPIIIPEYVSIDEDNDIFYSKSSNYNPEAFKSVIDDCFSIMKILKEQQLKQQLKQKMDRINDDF